MRVPFAWAINIAASAGAEAEGIVMAIAVSRTREPWWRRSMVPMLAPRGRHHRGTAPRERPYDEYEAYEPHEPYDPPSNRTGIHRAEGGLLRNLYDQHAEPLLMIILEMTDGDRRLAEDVVRETLLSAWRDVESIDVAATSLRPWLVGLARRILRDMTSYDQSLPRDRDADRERAFDGRDVGRERDFDGHDVGRERDFDGHDLHGRDLHGRDFDGGAVDGRSFDGGAFDGDVEREFVDRQFVDREVERDAERGFDRGIERDFDRGVDRDLDRGVERDFERGLQRDLSRGLDRGFERDVDRGIDRSIEPESVRAGARAAVRSPARDRDPVVEIGDDVGQALQRMMVLDGLRALQRPDRQILIEAYFRGRGVRDVAEELGLPPETVKWRLFFALRALQKILLGAGSDNA
ncbi:sigma-70 family RNA polymerase sigma factor [Actinomycetes bacterium KLBMP 9797]